MVDGLENSRVGGWYAGEPAVIIDVQRQPGANVVETVDRVLRELPVLQKSLSAGVTLKVVHDSTDTIRASIRDVEFTLVLAAGLVVLVVLLFLRTVRATIIAGVALPLSIVATFGVMWAAGFSLDNLSLMALTIGTGFVVDDAIVMIENVVRQIEDGEPPLEAALKGAREIGFTVVSLTASLIAVFIPLLFMSGIVGRMFREFALTLTFAVIVSAVISLTLTPMMCGRLLRAPRHGAREPWFLRAAEAPIGWMARGYEVTLGWALRRQGLMTLVSLLTLGLTIYLYVVVPKGFLPVQDTGLIDVVLEGAPSASFAEMGRLQAEAERAVRTDPAVTGVVAVIGVGTLNPTSNVAHLQLTLKPSDDRREDARAIAERVRGELGAIPGATAFVKPVQDIQIATTASRSQYQYTLTGTDADQVTNWANKLVRRMKRDPLFAHVADEVQDGGLRAFVDIDRGKAGRLGITAQMIDDTLNDAFGQRQISTIYGQSNQYRVILEAAPGSADDPRILDKLYVGVTSGTTSSTTSTGGVTTAATTTAATPGAQVPLVSFATLKRTTAPLSVAHLEQFPAATISFDLAEGASLGQAVAGIADARARHRHAGSAGGRLRGRRRRVPALARRRALAGAGRRGDDLPRAGRALRELHPPAHHPVDPALGRRRRAAGPDGDGPRAVDRGADRHHPADGHREEERHHDDRLRHRGGARGGAHALRRHRARLPPALPPHHDDHAGGAVRRHPAGAGPRLGRRAARAARHHHHRRPAAEPAADALHDPGDLPADGGARPPLRDGHGADPRGRGRGGAGDPAGGGVTVCYKGPAIEEGAMTLMVDVTEVAARLDELLAEAEAGRRVVILRGTEPVATIEKAVRVPEVGLWRRC